MTGQGCHGSCSKGDDKLGTQSDIHEPDRPEPALAIGSGPFRIHAGSGPLV